MPLKFFTTLDGRDVPIGAVDIRSTVKDFGLPPADVAALVADQSGRGDVRPDQITGSQIGKGARQIYLEDTIDYSQAPARMMAALRGTMRHAMVSCEHNGLLVEQRVVSKSGRFSMKYDSFVPETGVLRDKKAVGFFKVLLVLKHGVMEAAKDYVFQLNLGAILLRQNGQVVKEMYLDFEPQGVGKLEKGELEAKFGIKDSTFVPVAVPFLDEAQVLDAYEQLYRAKAEARKTGIVPPMCTSEQTWGGKRCTQGWCPVAKQCAEIAAERGERHPLNKEVAA